MPSTASELQDYREVIEDDAADDDNSPQVSYDITSYGADFDVFGLIRRLDNGDIVIPSWQRSYIWTIRAASSFIESLLLGLPVPGVFLGVDPNSKALYVIDGQQRLKTLQYFHQGVFPPTGREFTLRQVSPRFEGAKYESLTTESRRTFDDSLIHATIVRQDAPPEDDTSMCEVFRRLNTGGRLVNPQEIRGAIYRGLFVDRLKELNQDDAWRTVLGQRPSPRLRDEEMVLRFFAMWHSADEYRKPMSEFLDRFTSRHRNPDIGWLDETTELFRTAIGQFAEAKGREAFRLEGSRTVNAATLDSMMIGLAKRIDGGPSVPTVPSVRRAHNSLIESEEYLSLVTMRTSDDPVVHGRLRLAIAKFQNGE